MAFNFGLANDYNVFVFGDMNLSNTDAEGRVAVGGNATLSNYGIGSGIIPLPPANTDPSFVIDGNVNVTAGSNASGNTVVNPGSTIINYTMGNPNGLFIAGTPIDFIEAERYLKCASNFWSALAPNGTGEVIFNQLNLTGTDETLNIFSLDSSNLYGTGISLAQLNGINIIAPLERHHPDQRGWHCDPIRQLPDFPERNGSHQRKCAANPVELSPGVNLDEQHDCHLWLGAGPLRCCQHHIQPDQWQHHF